MKKLIIILCVTFVAGFLTSCVPLFYGDVNYPHGRRYYSNERHEGRRSHQRHGRDNSNNGRNDNNFQYNNREQH